MCGQGRRGLAGDPAGPEGRHGVGLGHLERHGHGGGEARRGGGSWKQAGQPHAGGIMSRAWSSIRTSESRTGAGRWPRTRGPPEPKRRGEARPIDSRSSPPAARRRPGALRVHFRYAAGRTSPGAPACARAAACVRAKCVGRAVRCADVPTWFLRHIAVLILRLCYPF